MTQRRPDAAFAIRPLAETSHASLVARWLHAAWWADDGWSLPETEAFLRRATGPAAPCAFVAESDGAPIGTAMLDTDDLGARPDLGPWLASVWVEPAWRGRGVATALVSQVETAARALGYSRLWLFTPDAAGFYAARGWQLAGSDAWLGRPVVLMSREIA